GTPFGERQVLVAAVELDELEWKVEERVVGLFREHLFEQAQSLGLPAGGSETPRGDGEDEGRHLRVVAALPEARKGLLCVCEPLVGAALSQQRPGPGGA